MVSLDIVSLFTKVPTDETLAVVWDKLAADLLLEERIYIPIDNLIEMLTFCVKTTYFGMGSDIYWQDEGLTMGFTVVPSIDYGFHCCPQYWLWVSLLSPVLTIIFMEYFEEMASLKSSMWLRYVDGTFILWPRQEDVQTLLDHVNSIRPSIQFTLEKEWHNKLPFLNVLVTCTVQGFRSSVYCKPTFTRQYLNFNSHQLYNVKKEIVCCL